MNRDMVTMGERTDEGDIEHAGPMRPEDFVFFPPGPLDKLYAFMDKIRADIYRIMGIPNG